MHTNIQIRQIIKGRDEGRFTCAPEVAHTWPGLARYAEGVGETSVAELGIGGLTVYAKLEWENPGGTVKDRAVLGMLHALLQRNGRPRGILEYTGGSLGLSLAQMCARLDIPLTLFLSASTPASVFRRLDTLGCALEIVPKELGFWGVMNGAIERGRQRPELTFLYQHENPANLGMHQTQTGEELLAQTRGLGFDAWVAAVGTGGTYAGVLSALRRRQPGLPGFVVTPAEMPFGTEAGPNALPKFVGAGGLGYGRRQKFIEALDPAATHLHFTYDECRALMLAVYRRTGWQIGSSAAANLLGCIEAGRRFGHRHVATVFPSRPSLEEAHWLETHKEEEHEHDSALIREARPANRAAFA